MPSKLYWTAARDLQIRRLRAEGASWDTVAGALMLPRYTVIARGWRIGAIKSPDAPRFPPEDPTREPLPAGHPRTWGPLTQGTTLEGTPYPLPCFP